MRRITILLASSALLLSALLTGCVQQASEPIGLAPSQAGTGPMVKWNMQAKPLPDIPFPNDIATWPDPTSPTGLRVNASMIAPTSIEASARQNIDTLDGFGIFAPITVEFTQQINLDDLYARQTGDDNFAGNAIYLINLNPGSPRYGQPMILEMGHGTFPVILQDTSFFWKDERAGESNLEFETVDETLTGDTNHDGIIESPNVLDLDSAGHAVESPETDPMTFYERASNTLIIRPLLPLDEESRYAVVLTKRLIGTNNQPVRSPFDWVNDVSQTDSLSPLLDDGILTKLGLTVDDVAFAWTFTTQSTTRDLVAIRQGMEGLGPFADIASNYPAEIENLEYLKDWPDINGQMYVADGDLVRQVLQDPTLRQGGFFPSGPTLDALLVNYQYVDYIVSGYFESPTFMGENDPLAHEVWHINSWTGDHPSHPGRVYWAMAVPKTTAQHKPPFPVTVQIHGYTSSRAELLAWAGTWCRFGQAVVVMDAWGHGGGELSATEVAIIKQLLVQYGLSNSSVIFSAGRARDLDGSGYPSNGGDFWVADTFHLRDNVRQTVVDTMQLIRILKSFDGVRKWKFDTNGNGKADDLAGDFNGDRVVDVGGPYNHYAIAGGSLGGILTDIIPAVEPSADVGVSVSGAAGLPDVGVRSTQGGVNEAVLLRIIGPLVIACGSVDANDQCHPWTATQTSSAILSWQVPDVNQSVIIPFDNVPTGVQPNDRVEVYNLANNEMRWTVVGTGGDLSFRAPIPASQGDPIQIVFRQGPASNAAIRTTLTTIDRDVQYQHYASSHWASGSPIVAVTEGYGLRRQTPDFRRFWNIAGMVTEPGDPISYARHYFLEPLQILPSGPHPVNMVISVTTGDHAVPIAAGLEAARVAGLLPSTRQEAEDPDLRYGRGIPWDGTLSYSDWYSKKLTWDQWRAKVGNLWSPDQLGLADNPSQVTRVNWVDEGIPRLRRFQSDPRYFNSQQTLLDADDLSNGTSGFGQPILAEPLRVTRRTATGISALRIPYVSTQGSHGIPAFYDPTLPFDPGAYMQMLLGHYFDTDGQELIDTPCLAKEDCEFIPPPIIDPTTVPVPTVTLGP